MHSILVALVVFCSAPSVVPVLRQVQLLFRHGERTPTSILHFPSEHNDTSPEQMPFDLGEMTTQGMWQEFQLGRRLRTAYGSHIGDTYRSREISVYSGRDNRSVASAQLVLASLLPPKNGQLWNRELPWQPIPIETDEIWDHASFGLYDKCPVESSRVDKSPQYGKMAAHFAPLIAELTQKTGMPIPNLDILQKVLDTIVTRGTLSSPDLLPLPRWASSSAFLDRIWHSRLDLHEQMVDLFLGAYGGWHMDQLIGRMDDVVNNRTRQKTVLYSGHDSNILTLGRLLRISPIDDLFCNYAAYLAFELHQRGNEHFVEIYFHPELDGDSQRLRIDGCADPCPFAQFRTLRPRTTSAQWMAQCKGTPLGDDQCTLYGSIAVATTVVLIVLLICFLGSLAFTSIFNKCRYERLNSARTDIKMIANGRQPLLLPIVVEKEKEIKKSKPTRVMYSHTNFKRR